MKAKYALSALAYLAREPSGEPIGISVIARDQAIPTKFLGLIFFTLKQHGVIESRRGFHGGCYLARPPEQITVLSVLEALGDGQSLASRTRRKSRPAALLPSEETSAIQEILQDLEGAVTERLATLTLADLVAKARGREWRKGSGQ
jgi:Rrf2 family protein